MIKLHYYQVYNNGIGGIITDIPGATKVKDRGIPAHAVIIDREVSDERQLNALRKEIEAMYVNEHRKDVAVMFKRTEMS